MTTKELLQVKNRFGYTMCSFGLEAMMEMLEKGTYEIYDGDASIPQSISVFKLYKKIPIRLVCVSENRDGKLVHTIVQGGSEIKNLIDWVKNGTPVTIDGKEVLYDDLNADGKDIVLNIHCFANIVISQNPYSKQEKLTTEQMIELARDFV